MVGAVDVAAVDADGRAGEFDVLTLGDARHGQFDVFGDPVGGQPRVEARRTGRRRLGVPAVHRRLVGLPPRPDPGDPLDRERVPGRGTGIDSGQVVGERCRARSQPHREIRIGARMGDVARAGGDGVADREVGPTMDVGHVFDEGRDVPTRAGVDRRVDRTTAVGRRHAIGVGPQMTDVGGDTQWRVHGPTVAVPADSLNGMSPLEALAADARGSSASEPIISITPEAIDQLRELRDDEAEAEKLGLRLAIASAPGEDFRYDLSFDEYLKAAFTDEVRTHDGLKVIIPGNDVELLEGATLDYTSTQGLVIRNPNRPRPPMVEGLTSDDALSAEIEAMVAADVNPALAADGGFVTYVGHDGAGTAYLTMGGGCHGCSMSKMTMLEGVQTMLVEAIDEIERVKDLTDHATGENPFYS